MVTEKTYEALNILNTVTAQVNTNRAGHAAIQEALAEVQRIVDEAKESQDSKKSKETAK
jgi:hypothetical protein